MSQTQSEKSINHLKASELILRSIEDLERIEKLPDYKVDMSYWYSRDEDTCSVCLAGAVMAFLPRQSLQIGDRLAARARYPDAYCLETSKRLQAINAIRTLRFRDFLQFLGHQPWRLDFEMPNFMQEMRDYANSAKRVTYAEDPVEFKKILRGVAEVLESYDF